MSEAGHIRDVLVLCEATAPWLVWNVLRGRTVGLAERALRGTLSGVYRHHGPEGVWARSWATGSSVIWVGILLLLCLIVYYR